MYRSESFFVVRSCSASYTAFQVCLGNIQHIISVRMYFYRFEAVSSGTPLLLFSCCPEEELCGGRRCVHASLFPSEVCAGTAVLQGFPKHNCMVFNYHVILYRLLYDSIDVIFIGTSPSAHISAYI
jgi:hypothetical protein